MSKFPLPTGHPNPCHNFTFIFHIRDNDGSYQTHPSFYCILQTVLNYFPWRGINDAYSPSFGPNNKKWYNSTKVCSRKYVYWAYLQGIYMGVLSQRPPWKVFKLQRWIFFIVAEMVPPSSNCLWLINSNPCPFPRLHAIMAKLKKKWVVGSVCVNNTSWGYGLQLSTGLV